MKRIYGSRFIQHVVLPCFTSKNEVLIIPNQLNFETWHHHTLGRWWHWSPTSSSFCRSSSACRSRSWYSTAGWCRNTALEHIKLLRFLSQRGFIQGRFKWNKSLIGSEKRNAMDNKNKNQKPREVRVPLLLPFLLLAGAKTRTSKRILPRLLVFSFVTIVNTLFKLHSAAAPPNYSFCTRCTHLTQRSLTPWVMTCANQMVRMQHVLSSWTAFIGPLWEDEFSILGTYVRSIWNILGPSFEAIETDHTSSNSNLHMVINQVGVLRS